MNLEDNEIEMLLAAVWGALAGTILTVLFFLFI